jgi:phosphate transport system permease protein
MDTKETWSLTDSLLRGAEIRAEVSQKYPEAELEFRSWLTPQFLVTPMSSRAEFAGVRTAILGSLWLVGIAVLFALPIGTGAAIYLQEYAPKNMLTQSIQTNINNLAGVPSIVYGMLGLALFVRVMEPITSGTLFGVTDSNGRTIFSAGLTMGILVLPIVIINAQEAIKAVPDSLRQAAYGVGATRLQTIWHHVLPNALPGILTGTILAVSRALGETAPLIVVGASTFISVDPDGPFSKFTALPIQIYQWTTRAQSEFHAIAAGAIIVLLILLLTLNATAILLRNRFQRRYY